MINRSFAIIGLCLLAACGGPKREMKLYPLQGPIAAKNPTLVINVDARDTDQTSGSLRFHLPNRVKCEGTWTSVAPREISKKTGLSLTFKGPRGDLGKETKTVAGVNNGEIYAVCSDGTKVQGRFLIGSGTVSGTGSATDTGGNVYKLLF